MGDVFGGGEGTETQATRADWVCADGFVREGGAVDARAGEDAEIALEAVSYLVRREACDADAEHACAVGDISRAKDG